MLILLSKIKGIGFSSRIWVINDLDLAYLLDSTLKIRRISMSKKVFNLIVAVSGGIASIAGGVVAYLDPSYTPAIISAIGIVETAVVEICNLFVKPE